MQIDERWMTRWFDEYNRRYFSGVLPRPAFKVGRSRTRLGSYTCRKVRQGLFVKTEGQTITLSCYYNLGEKEEQDVLLHEMIHYFIDHTHRRDSSPHGALFRSIMARLNADGHAVSVSRRGLSPAAVTPAAMSPRLVMAVELHDGGKMLSAVNPRYARRIASALQASPEVRRASWYVTRDAWFADKPRVQTARGIRVDDAFFEAMTARMTLFRPDGTTKKFTR